MSYDELELDTLGDRKTALFLIMSDTDDTFNFVIAILQSQLFNLLCDKADDEYNGKLPIHVRFLLDEFANIGQIPRFDKLIATIPHNSKCRYGERGTAAAKPKAQIILCVLSSILATQMPYRTPSRSEALRSATAACGGSWRGDPPERCLSRQAGIVRCCQNCPLEN